LSTTFLPHRGRNALKKENPDWSIEDIEEKTGVNIRYISSPEQTATDMAALLRKKFFLPGCRKKR
jgi:hypothetical protein